MFYYCTCKYSTLVMEEWKGEGRIGEEREKLGRGGEGEMTRVDGRRGER